MWTHNLASSSVDARGDKTKTTTTIPRSPIRFMFLSFFTFLILHFSTCESSIHATGEEYFLKGKQHIFHSRDPIDNGTKILVSVVSSLLLSLIQTNRNKVLHLENARCNTLSPPPSVRQEMIQGKLQIVSNIFSQSKHVPETFQRSVRVCEYWWKIWMRSVGSGYSARHSPTHGRLFGCLALLLIYSLLVTFASLVSAESCTSSDDCDLRICLVKNVTISTEGICSPCSKDSQCSDRESRWVCRSDGTCGHKNLLPITVSDILVLLLCSVGGMLAAGAGIGGGPIFVSILTLIGNFSSQEASPLSNVMIFGGALMNLIINIRQRHPEADRPVIDTEATLLLEPSTLLGSVLGVLINVVSPNWFLSVVLIVVLFFTTIKTTQKGIKIYKKETAVFKSMSELELSEITSGNESEGRGSTEGEVRESDVDDNSEIQNHDSSSTHLIESKNDSSSSRLDEGPRGRLAEMLEEDRYLGWKRITALVICVLVVFLVSLVKGGHGATSVFGVENCSGVYWFFLVLNFAFLLAVTYFSVRMLVKRYSEKVSVGYPFVEGDIKYTMSKSLRLALLCSFAGVLAGALGVGGGIVKAPIMLALGMNPTVVAATASFMIFFTTSSTVIQFSIIGRVIPDYGILFFITGMIASFIGQKAIGAAVKRWKRQSYVIFALGATIGIACVLLIYVSTLQTISDVQKGQKLGFASLCED